jgi:hypothetical protein
MLCPSCTTAAYNAADSNCSVDDEDGTGADNTDSVMGSDESGDEDDDSDMVKDLEYWKMEADKSSRVSLLLCEWYRTKSVALDNLKTSSTEKIQFAENELSRHQASSSEKATMVANEMLRERVANSRERVESCKAYSAVVREGKRARATITELESEVEQMETAAGVLAEYHAENSVPKHVENPVPKRKRMKVVVD